MPRPPLTSGSLACADAGFCHQAIELQLKELIETGYRCLEIDEVIDKRDGHNLVRLGVVPPDHPHRVAEHTSD